MIRKLFIGFFALLATAVATLTWIPGDALSQARRTVDIEIVNGQILARGTQAIYPFGAIRNRTVYATGVSLPVVAPASATAACTAGQFAVSANAIHVCTATNTWKSAPLGAFTP